MLSVIIALSIFFFLLIVIFSAGLYFYNMGVARRKKSILNGNPDLAVENPEEAWDSAVEWMEKQKIDEVIMKSEDDLSLHAYYIKSKVSRGKTVILAHGYSSKGKDMGGFAKFYNEVLGFNVLMPDNRGHGSSEGNYIGFGWNDRKDYMKWIDYIIKRNGDDCEIVLHGVSMGGGTVLMVSGEELSKNVEAIISDCAYTSAKAILSYQMKRMYRLPDFPLIPTTSLICRLRAGYSFSEASALRQVGKAKVPILFIHGSKDAFVPTEMVYELYEKCSSEKELYIVQGAGHGNAYFYDRKGYEEKVIDFIDKYIK